MQRRFAISLVVLVIFPLLSCRKHDALSNIRHGDFSIVCKDTYRGQLRFVGEGKEHKGFVDALRREIERNSDVLDLISERFYTIPYYAYRFKFAAVDERKNLMVLRYFARIIEHPVYAGYQIQFLFDLESQKLVRVYTSEVPLE